MEIEWNEQTQEWDYLMDDDLWRRISVSDSGTVLTGEQYAILGLPSPAPKGWKSALRGTTINERQLAALKTLNQRQRKARARKDEAFQKMAARRIDRTLIELHLSTIGFGKSPSVSEDDH